MSTSPETMSVAKIEPETSLRDKVEEALSAAIVSGEMRPGQLYSVPALALQFEVSPTPVREAMLNLEEKGLVEPVRNRGFRVSDVSERDLEEIVMVRQLLEPPAMRELARRFPQQEAERLRRMADAIVAGARKGNLRSYLKADHVFHLALLESLGNRVLVGVVAELRARTRLIGLAGMLRTEALDESAAEHHRLLDLLADGDGDRASALMRRHINHAVGWWAGRDEEASS